jgi:hypothetical protein
LSGRLDWIGLDWMDVVCVVCGVRIRDGSCVCVCEGGTVMKCVELFANSVCVCVCVCVQNTKGHC